MKRRSNTPEQVIRKLAEADKLLDEVKTIEEACRHLEIIESTYHRWRNQFGGMKSNDASWPLVACCAVIQDRRCQRPSERATQTAFRERKAIGQKLRGCFEVCHDEAGRGDLDDGAWSVVRPPRIITGRGFALKAPLLGSRERAESPRLIQSRRRSSSLGSAGGLLACPRINAETTRISYSAAPGSQHGTKRNANSQERWLLGLARWPLRALHLRKPGTGSILID
jgi:hypothetical protein